MGLLDDLKNRIFKPAGGVEAGGLATEPGFDVEKLTPSEGRGDFGQIQKPIPGLSVPGQTLTPPTMPPMMGGTGQPQIGFGMQPMQPTTVVVQQPMPATESRSQDLYKEIERLEDRILILNEKVDIILRELRTISERASERRF